MSDPKLAVPVPGLSEALEKYDALEKRQKAAQPQWRRHLKQALAIVVIGCGAALPMLSPTSDALAYKACAWVLAVGAGLGITSSGNPPRQGRS